MRIERFVEHCRSMMVLRSIDCANMFIEQCAETSEESNRSLGLSGRENGLEETSHCCAHRVQNDTPNQIRSLGLSGRQSRHAAKSSRLHRITFAITEPRELIFHSESAPFRGFG
jgi:hypothetical protein